MRLGRLDLIRYGHFTGRSVELPRGQADFHLIFGPNEAGKSTTLAAIEDLLFSVSERSPYGFLHGHQNMRIGALLEGDNATLELVRRKGRKDTLLDTQGNPLAGGEALLRSLLAGSDQAFFQRMFSLDHERLRSGGQEILEAKDEVGQMLFSAGSGIAGLRDLLTALSEEADGLFAARRAKERRFYIVQDRLAAAQSELREQTLTSSKWQELKRARDQAEAAFETVSEEIKEKTVESNRLERIRRVFHNLRHLQELDGELEGLAQVIALPAEAASDLHENERKDSLAAARRTTLEEQVHQAEKSLDGLTFDAALIAKADDVRSVGEQGIRVRSGKESLPRREAELAVAESDLRTDARELGWTEPEVAALVERIPPRSKVKVVRALLPRHGKLASEVEGNRHRLEEGRDALDAAQRQLAESDSPLDVSRLAATIRALREQGDLSSNVRNAVKALKEAEGRVARRLGTLSPVVADETLLVTMLVPSPAEVQGFRDREQDWKRRLQAVQQQSLSHRQEREAAEAAFEQRVRDEKLITPEELDEARESRDRLWALVKAQHLAGGAIPEAPAGDPEAALPDPAGAFEPAMAAADALADRRFEQAEAAGQIAEIRRKIGELETLLAQSEENERRLSEEGRALAADWSGMWKTAPFQPASAEAMLQWLDDRKDLLEEIEARETARIAWRSLDEEERDARDHLLTELAAISFDIVTLKGDSLPVVIERAAAAQAGEEAKARQRVELEASVEQLTGELLRQEQRLAKAKESFEAWQQDWKIALAELGLAEELAVEAIEPALDLIEDLRETAGKIRDLRHNRIDKIKQDLASFDQAVSGLIAGLADDLADLPAQEAISKLLQRLNEAETAQGRHKTTSDAAEALKEKIEALDEEGRERAASLTHLMEMAAVTCSADLKQAIAQSDRKRTLQSESLEVAERLRRDGDGKTPEELAAESAEVAFDEISAKTESIAAEVEVLRVQERDAIETRAKAREAFLAVGGDDAAARAAANREEALAEMHEVAARYVRVKTSATLLHWAIDRYRREKQAPLLTRAGALFAVLTGGSFSSLEVAFDEQDKAELRGLRPEGDQLAISGMSSGTADQLYLALRVAAIEDYLERAEALPFVADDLFINFDDARAMAGLRILQGLSHKTQVLFFTHHRHLVDLAEKSFEGSVNLVTLSDRQAGPS